ncbi:MAG: hypothetical protein EOP05_01425 [Proteobacteria bacterium]|nr:MAG: hypothetical protein EOP05_01425 [Pseudomonadota bacterium]
MKTMLCIFAIALLATSSASATDLQDEYLGAGASGAHRVNGDIVVPKNLIDVDTRKALIAGESFEIKVLFAAGAPVLTLTRAVSEAAMVRNDAKMVQITQMKERGQDFCEATLILGSLKPRQSSIHQPVHFEIKRFGISFDSEAHKLVSLTSRTFDPLFSDSVIGGFECTTFQSVNLDQQIVPVSVFTNAFGSMVTISRAN